MSSYFNAGLPLYEQYVNIVQNTPSIKYYFKEGKIAQLLKTNKQRIHNNKDQEHSNTLHLYIIDEVFNIFKKNVKYGYIWHTLYCENTIK